MKDPISQTLFRFVSLRNPDISDEKEKEVRFMYPSENAKKGTFYAAIPEPESGASVMNKMQEVAVSFKALSREGLAKVDGKLFEFSQWLVQNRSTYTLEELSSAISGLTPLENDTVLWDNLFYQFITEDDFYAKETVIHMLKANHVIAHYSKAVTQEDKEAALNRIIYATVLLPSALFEDETVANNSEKSTRTTEKTFSLPEALMADIAAEDLRSVHNAQEEIEELHVAYQDEYHTAYQAALKKNESDSQALLDQYDAAVQAAEAQWCKDRGNIPYDEENPCDKPAPVKYPVLPELTFSFRDEIDPKGIQADLSVDAFETLNTLKSIDKVKSFEQAKQILAQEEERLTTELYENTSFYNKSVSVKGTIIPVAKTAAKLGDVAYRGGFCSKARKDIKKGTWSWKFYADIESSSDSIAAVSSATTKVYKPDGTLLIESTSFAIIASGSDLVRINLLALINDITDSSLRLESTVTFSDGVSLSFNGTLRPNTCGLGTSSGSTTNPPNPNPDERFVPSGYGMRQLGIADYRKVEQSVHCYLEGEVSHIENVMAREYKEKSTRRLRVSENTTSTTSDTEKEKLTDTTTTNRHEMHNEVSQVLSEAQDFSASTSFSAGWESKLGGTYNLGAGTNFATHTSSEDSINQAMTEAQEITARAMDRVVQRVKEERITKIVEEYEENNTHGFDNRKGDKHVVGVYRWIDKVYKNQIYNYGRRLMYEFSIPQPSKLHRLAMTEAEGGSSDSVELNEPIDPRTVVIGGQVISDASKINTSNYKKLAAMYGAEVNAIELNKTVSDSFSVTGNSYIAQYNFPGASNFKMQIPEGYMATGTKFNAGFVFVPKKLEYTYATVAVEKYRITSGGAHWDTVTGILPLDNIENELAVSFTGADVGGIRANVTAYCAVTPDTLSQWQLETFNAILAAYEKKLAAYMELKGQEEEKVETLKKSNPLFYRQIEQTVLRKNCLSYLMDQAPTAKNTYGKKMYTGDALTNHEVTVTEPMNDYAAFAQFLEQAFEWEIMSYYFYPFYWANRNEWSDLYTYENDDPLFRSFMQAGLARVVLTVRPGFEEAVLHYMATGSIWNGGELPVLEDPLYLSVVDELKKPIGVKEGKAWKTQVPTSLTILQADSLGLKVEKALPCNCDDISDFIESDQTECSSQILNDSTVFNDLQVGNDTATLKREIQFTFHNNSGSNFKTIAEFDDENAFPLVFKCMGQEITIQRDAAWSGENSAGIIYQKLAAQVSLISGITAKQVFDKAGNSLGLQFKVDTDKIGTFTFQKSANNGAVVNPISDVLIMEINSEGIVVKEPTHYTQRIEDKFNTPLTLEEANTLLPIGRFLI